MSHSERKWVNGGPILLVEDNPDDILLTLRALRKNHIPNEKQDIIDSYRLGANSYIRKPVGFDQFVGAVEHLGLYWLSLNILPPDPQGG